MAYTAIVIIIIMVAIYISIKTLLSIDTSQCITDLTIYLTMTCAIHVHVTYLSLFLYVCLHLSPREVQCLSPRLLTSLSLLLHSFPETLLQHTAMAAHGSVQCNVYFLFSARPYHIFSNISSVLHLDF